jgi:tetratricopeptide (TPR) repeat protein
VLVIYGLAGIGKTSLLLSAARDHAQRVAGVAVYHVCTEDERIGTVLASLLARDQPSAPRLTSLRDGLAEVAHRAHREPLVFCIDDAHRLSDPMLFDVLSHLCAASSSLWIVLAARRELPLADSNLDSAVLRLGPLSTVSARALWDDLESRLGPSIIQFDALDPTRHGNPFALRRAFATGRPVDVELVDLTGLASFDASLLAQICAFREPVAVVRLAVLIPDLVIALPRLVHALLVDAIPSGHVAIHDLVRAAVLRSARPPGPAEHLVCLKYYEAAETELITRVHHTVGAARWSDTLELIDRVMRPHDGFFPMGSAIEAELLAAFAALEQARVAIPLGLRLAQLQLTARHGGGRAVLDSLQTEAAREPMAWAHLGTVELLLGDALAAELHLRQALADPSATASPSTQAFLLAVLGEVLRTQGRVDDVRVTLRQFEDLVTPIGPLGVAIAQLLTAAMSYDQERYEDAAMKLASSRRYIALLTFVPALQATHTLLERAARAGLLTSPDEAPPAPLIARALFEDVDFLRATLLLFAADGDLLEGNIEGAEVYAREAEEITTRGGYRGIQQWAIYVRAECLYRRGFSADAAELAERALASPFVEIHRRQRLLLRTVAALSLAQLGRAHEARGRVESLDDFAHAPVKAARLGVLPWIAPPAVDSALARAEHALAQFERALVDGRLDLAQHWSEGAAPVRRSRWEYLRARVAVLDAELAVRTADTAQAERALAEAEALCSQRGYGRERAVAALIGVALARLTNDPARAMHWTQVAAERAAGILPGVEAAARWLTAGPTGSAQAVPAWIDRLELAAPLIFRLRESVCRRYLTAQQARRVGVPAGTCYVDALQLTVHVGAIECSFASRPGLWSVLSALLTEPGHVVSPDEVARRAWGVSYHPIHHRSRLVVSIKRLRDALGAELIEATNGGYRLCGGTWAVLEPIADASAMTLMAPTVAGRGEDTSDGATT